MTFQEYLIRFVSPDYISDLKLYGFTIDQIMKQLENDYENTLFIKREKIINEILKD